MFDNLTAAGKVLIVIGCLFILSGCILLFYDKIPFLGKLPGDISVKKENFSFYFPLTSCILLSLILSFIVWLIKKL